MDRIQEIVLKSSEHQFLTILEVVFGKTTKKSLTENEIEKILEKMYSEETESVTSETVTTVKPVKKTAPKTTRKKVEIEQKDRCTQLKVNGEQCNCRKITKVSEGDDPLLCNIHNNKLKKEAKPIAKSKELVEDSEDESPAPKVLQKKKGKKIIEISDELSDVDSSIEDVIQDFDDADLSDLE